MALIEVHHVVADQYTINTDTNPNIIEGKVVALNSSGDLVVCNTSLAPVGIAGDSTVTNTGHTPYAEDLVISSTGITRSTSNRVSDFFNEGGASGMVTVYHSGGKFHTDQYDTADTFTPGAALYSDANGLLSVVNAGSQIKVGTCVVPPRQYPSGVPGTDVNGSTTLGSYMTFILAI